MRSVLAGALIMLTSCGSKEWRMGNSYKDPKITDKREDERDRHMKRANNFRKQTAKHYIKEYKSHDGKINFFKRDGFDWGF